MIINSTMAQQYGVKHTRILQRELQKLTSECEKWVTVQPNCKGRSVEIPFIAKHNMRARTQRGESIVRGEDKFGNIHMYPRLFYNATEFCNDDKLFNTDIEFTIQDSVREDMSAIVRTRDEVILGVGVDTNTSSATNGEYIKLTAATAPASVYASCGGILGTNYMGQTGTTLHDLGDADTGNDLTTHVVPADFVFAGAPVSSGITLEKITRAIQLLKKRHAITKGVSTVVVGLTSRQLAELQLLEQAQNQNYGWGNLVEGYKNKVLGVHIMESECLPVISSNGNLLRVCPMWVKESVRFGMWQDANVRIDAHLQDSVDTGQIVTTCAFGCTRRHMDSVIQILCDENITPSSI